MVLAIFQNATPNSTPPIGLLNDKNAPNAIEAIIGSICRQEINGSVETTFYSHMSIKAL